MKLQMMQYSFRPTFIPNGKERIEAIDNEDRSFFIGDLEDQKDNLQMEIVKSAIRRQEDELKDNYYDLMSSGQGSHIFTVKQKWICSDTVVYW